MKVRDTACPCDPTRSYTKCCGRFHDGLQAPNAEALMRSRYSAYARNVSDYLLDTWHPDTRPVEVSADSSAPKWIHLEVIRHEATGEHSAIVEFVARYRLGGKAARMHELSRFVEKEGRWYYVDGDQID